VHGGSHLREPGAPRSLRHRRAAFLAVVVVGNLLLLCS
jgi:hypothetical protein